MGLGNRGAGSRGKGVERSWGLGIGATGLVFHAAGLGCFAAWGAGV